MTVPNKSSQSNPELVEFRLDEQAKTLDRLGVKVDAGFAAINKRMDEFTFTPKSEFDKLSVAFISFKEDVEKNYVKKSDGKTLRNIGISVVASIAITLATLILNTITKNGIGQ